MRKIDRVADAALAATVDVASMVDGVNVSVGVLILVGNGDLALRLISGLDIPDNQQFCRDLAVDLQKLLKVHLDRLPGMKVSWSAPVAKGDA